nr:reverse transcriptase domain-containing protein [Tanacetum cinerariifolium]
MSAMANPTPIVTIVTKAANKEKTPKEANAALKVNILDFYEEHYEDILLVIMDKICHDKRDSSPSRDRPRSRDFLRDIKESYGNTCSFYRTGARHRYHSRDRDRSRSMKRGRESESLLSRVSKSGTSDEGYWKSNSKRRKPTATTAFIPGETAAASKKKGHTSWKPQDQPKRTPKEILAVEAKNFKPPPPMVTQGTEGPLIIEAEIGEHMIHRMYVDGGSLMEVLYEHCFNRLWPKIKSQMVPTTTSLTGFNGETIWPLRQLRLLVIIGDVEHSTKEWMDFMIVRSLSPYKEEKGPGPKTCQSHPSRGTESSRESDEEKMAFHTSHGVYCYTKMPFGLKNAGAIYQRLVDKAFDSQVGWKIEVFLSKSAEKSLPLFKTLKKCIKKCDFHWTPKAEQAFKQLKQHLSELPMLVAPKPKEELIVYLSASHRAISAVLMTERDTVQTPVYFISCALQGPKLNYTSMEKLVLALVFTAKRAITKIELYAGRTQYHVPPNTDKPGGNDVYLRAKVLFTASNNEAKYEALIAGLRITAQTGVRNVHVSVDSKLAANQVLRTYVAKEENMIKYLKKAKSLVLVEVLKEKSIQEKEVATMVEEDGPTWMTPIMEYLKDGTLPDDRKKSGEEVRVGQHSVPLWRSGRNSLGQRTEAIIPAEIKMPTYRTTVVDAMHNDEELRLNLDLLEESRERAAIREAKAKLKMTKYYNARVQGVTFRPVDFVYRSNDASHAVDG